MAAKRSRGVADLPSVIDLEASGLGRGSYPIEVGFVLSDGSSYCTLIKPLPEWQHWDRQAQNLHGISRELLEKKGKHPREVALYLNQQLEGQTLYSDAWGNDNSWLGLLFDSVGMWPNFKLETIRRLLSEAQVEYWQQAKAQVIKELQLQRHRASSDALIIQRSFQLSLQLSAGNPPLRSIA